MTYPRWLEVLLSGWLTMIGWVVGALLTAWILWGPVLPFAYYSPRGDLMLETVNVCVALVAAYLAHGRFVRRNTVSDLFLSQSLVMFALAGIFGQLLDGTTGTAELWVPVALRGLAAVLLLGAALVPAHQTAAPGAAGWTALGPAILFTLCAVTAWWLAPVLPPAQEVYAGDHVHPELLTSHPAAIAVHLVSAGCLLLASHLFTVRALRSGDELLRWLGPACAFGGFARICYALTPTLYTDWFYTGDLLRTGFYLLLVIGSARELAQYWASRTVQALTEDRLRLARELHDGVVQELAYIRGEAHKLDPQSPVREHIIRATDRALDETRTAIHGLDTAAEASLPEMLHRAAHELGRRHGLSVEVEADEGVSVEPGQLHTLLRIAREAVTNAARHGRASLVRIELGKDDDGHLLVVRDDGTGFDPEQARRARNGYGLVSMNERARSLPGTLDLDSRPGTGSEVRVRW